MMNIQLLSCSIRTTPVQNGLSAAMSAIPMAQMVTEAVRPAVCGCGGGHIQCKWEKNYHHISNNYTEVLCLLIVYRKR